MAKKKVNVKDHILVPKHSKLSQKDKKELLQSLNITIRELPKITVNDSAIAELNPELGDIIKIERKSPTAGRAVYYRGVVHE